MDIRKFYNATEPSRALSVGKAEDRQYYIDFSSVRGGDIIQRLKNQITFWKPDEPTCDLFTGHIGCGKSTELLRLKDELETEGFYVVYFESSEDLEMIDVDIGDVLLAIASRISLSLEEDNIQLQATGLRQLLKNIGNVLQADVTGVKFQPPKVAGVELKDIGVTTKEGGEFSLAFGIGEITAKVKSDSVLRERLNQFLGPQKIQLIAAINQDLIETAIAKLKERGKKGLVVIVDNLDRIDACPKPWGRPQPEYLFIDQGEYLSRLNCHLIYTLPLALKFSNDYGMLTQRFSDPKVLPMIPVRSRDGSIHLQGMELLREMVMARAFPELKTKEERLDKIPDIFDSPDSLNRLCQSSGGHVRDLLRLLNDWIQEEMQLPLSRNNLEIVIRNRRNARMLVISDAEWELLRQVRQTKRVTDELGYQKLIRSRFVFEYHDGGEIWFDVNPILLEGEKLQS